MPDRNEHDRVDDVLSDLINALHVAAPLVQAQRIVLADFAHDARTLEAAVDRAVRAVRRLREIDIPRGAEARDTGGGR